MQGVPTTAFIFWNNINKSNACWLWLGPFDTKDGYGKAHYENKHWRAHRLAWYLTHGTLDPKLMVCHKCDNPPCVRPDHLFLGTAADNIADMHSKKRHLNLRTNKKLTSQKVEEIRAAYVPGIVLQRQLADRYGVSQGQVSAIINRYKGTWTDKPTT